MLDFMGIKNVYQLNTEIINILIFLHISCKVFITYYHYNEIFQIYVTKNIIYVLSTVQNLLSFIKICKHVKKNCLKVQ